MADSFQIVEGGSSKFYSHKLRRRCWLAYTVAVTLVAVCALAALVVVLVVNRRRWIDDDDDETRISNSSAKERDWRSEVCVWKKCPKDWNENALLLISFDGFRYDYLHRKRTPSIQRLVDCGVSAPYMYPSYPTKTFPNHYSIVTGLYPESHGIIDNRMYDPEITKLKNESFAIGSVYSLDSRWWKGEPIWNTVTKNSKRSATMFWPGSEVEIQGVYPTYTKPYNKSLPFSSRVDQMMDWLLLPDSKRPHFLTVYFDQPDTFGHQFGPNSEQVTDVLITVDAQVDYLMRRLLEENLLHCIDMVVVADHGMQDVLGFANIDSTGLFENDAMVTGPVARINVTASSDAELLDIGKKIQCQDKNQSYFVYTQHTTPKFYHYANNHRIGNIIVDGRAGMEITHNKYYWNSKGDHGYDNRYDTMKALFFAIGPSYKKNHVMRPFQNVELYNFFVDTLKLKLSAANNGTLGVMDEAFLLPPNRTRSAVAPPTCESLFGRQTSPEQCQPDCPKAYNYSADCISAKHELLIDQAQNSSMIACHDQTCGYRFIYDTETYMISSIQYFRTLSFGHKYSNECLFVYQTMKRNCNQTASIRDEALRDNLRFVPLHSISDVPRSLADDRLHVPMDNTFYTDIWLKLLGMYDKELDNGNQLLTFVGPIHDSDNDGLKDDISYLKQKYPMKSGAFLPIPTHFYYIVIQCNGTWVANGARCKGEPAAVTHILPHLQNNDGSCEKREEEYYEKHTARIRDVELLTGLQFFNTWPASEAIRLRTSYTAHLKMQL